MTGATERSSRRAHLPAQSQDWIAAALLFAAVGLLYFLISPESGAFHWSESPRNALNGAFVLDLLKDLPVTEPKAWAYAYYLQYPSLTILFYPPLLHAELAAVFALFGVSHTAAMGLMAAHAGLLAAGLYLLTRRIAGLWWAVAVSAVTLFSPEMLSWGRQVLLELPMLSLLVWAGWFWLRFLEQDRTADLVLAMVALLLAVYTKQTAIFIAPAFLVPLLSLRGVAVLRDRRLWVAGASVAVALTPLVALQLVFASFNVGSMTDQRIIDIPRWSWEGLSFYARALVTGLGPILALLCALGLWSSVSAALRGGPDPRRTAHQFLIVWWLSAYLILTLISLKLERYGLLMYPAILASGGAGLAALTQPWQRLHMALPGVLLALAAVNAVTLDPPHISGYRQAARYAVEHLTPGRRIAFSGNLDGAFVFNVRELDPARQLSVVRIDKLLLRINILKELGVGELMTNASPAEIAAMLAQAGIDILVVEPRFLTEVPSMRAFYEAIASSQFELLERIPVTSEPGVDQDELRVYRTRIPLPAENAPLRYEIPTANMMIRTERKPPPNADRKQPGP